MKTTLCSAALLACGLMAGATAQADTLKKIADSGKITLAYRESSVPFSYLAGAAHPSGSRWTSPTRWWTR